jgi:hypothetical protein
VQTASPSPLVQRLPVRSVAARWRWLLAVVGLCVATYLYAGYRYGVWPQPGFLANVYAFSGRLKGDWYTTDLPPAHWALDHGLVLLPHAWLEPAVLVLWVLGLVALWSGVLLIADALALPPATAFLAGLVLLPTGLGGFGVSESLVPYFYPGTAAFGCAVLAVGLALRGSPALAGATVGIAMLVHPAVGPYAVLVTLPLVLWVAGERRRALLRYAVPLVVLGLPSLIQLISDQLSGGTLTASELYDFLVIVRIPHHVRYASFTGLEYARTAAWGIGVVAGLAVLWRLRAARAIAIVPAVVAVVCGIAALATVVEWPKLLVEAQTARMSPFIVLVGVLALAAALHRLSPPWALVSLALTFLLAPRVVTDFGARFPDLSDVVQVSLVEAVGLLVALAAAVVAVRLRPNWSSTSRRLTEAVAVAALVGCAISLVIKRPDRVPGVDPVQADYDAIAAVARAHTAPGDLVVTPPEMDGFRVSGQRADVVEFGSMRLGHGDREWRQRVLDLTGDPAVLAPGSFGTDLPARMQRIADDYSRTIATSRRPVCRYDARMVITHADVPAPAWLRDVAHNATWKLMAVRPSACDGYRYRPVPDPVLGPAPAT